MPISTSIQNKILDIIFKSLDKNTITVFLFGSCARGKMRCSSDIDIGIFSNELIPSDTLMVIKHELNEQIPSLRTIDVVDFNRAEDPFRTIALQEVELWHQGNKSKNSINSLREHSKS